MATPPCQLCSQHSVYSCNCQHPPIACCHGCSYIHHEAPGVHRWTVLEQPGGRNVSCEHCQANSAKIVCCCSFPVTFLCMECRSEHILKDCMKIHIVQLIETSQKVKTWGDVERARRVLENKDRIEQYLSLNKSAAAKLKEEVNALAANLIARITSAAGDTVKEIANIEAEIEGKRQRLKLEVEAHLFDGAFRSADVLVTEAFNTSGQFICPDILRGELCREELIGTRLAQLQVPPFLTEREDQLPAAPLAPKRMIAQQGADWSSRSNIWGSLSLQGNIKGKALRAQPAESREFDVTEEMKASAHAPCRENFDVRAPEMPNTIGRHRLPIESLQGENQWNLRVENLHLLGRKYSSWRRSREDGNSFYRCVGVQLCEHYCRPNTPIPEFAAIYKLIVEQTPPFALVTDNREDLSRIKLLTRLLKDLYETRRSEGNALQKLQYFLQNPIYDRALVAAVRNYAASYLQLHADEPEVSSALAAGPAPVIQKILQYGKEAEGLALHFTAQVFNSNLHIITIDTTYGQTSEALYGPRASGWFPAMHLLYASGHYACLIPRELDISDHYDFGSNTYQPLLAEAAVGYEGYVD